MTFYLFLADRHGTGSGARWAIMGIAVKVGQSVGYFYVTQFIILLIAMCLLFRSVYVCFIVEVLSLDSSLTRYFLQTVIVDAGRWILSKPNVGVNCSGSCSPMILGNASLSGARRPLHCPILTARCLTPTTLLTSRAVSVFFSQCVRNTQLMSPISPRLEASLRV